MKQTPEEFLKMALEYKDAQQCLDWPFRAHRKGYGLIRKDNKEQLVSRLICTATYGKPKGIMRTHAAHSCNRPSCVNPHHLRWATPRENASDRDTIRFPAHPHALIINRLGGVLRVASLLQADDQAAYKWYKRGIPSKHWHRITALCPDITAEYLARTKDGRQG